MKSSDQQPQEPARPKHPPIVKWEGPKTFVSSISRPQTSEALTPVDTVSIGWPPVSLGPSRIATRLELLLTISGVALVVFMVMHMGLLFTSMVGAATMNSLASFLERYYLLHSVAPFLILLILGHVILASQKLPSTSKQQLTLVKHICTLWHLDTWMWILQIATGVAILILVSIHLWVILTDLPIEALKSGSRVHGVYLWFYIPFIILVEAHASAGLYRIAVKWDLMRRRWAHIVLALWTALFLALGFAILATFYWIGANP
jgi:fumarate reductase subunit C